MTNSFNTQSDNPQHTSHPGVTLRAILIGIILIPPNSCFIMANHLRFWSTLPTTMSIIYNVVITLTLLTSLNFLLKFIMKIGRKVLLSIFRVRINFAFAQLKNTTL